MRQRPTIRECPSLTMHCFVSWGIMLGAQLTGGVAFGGIQWGLVYLKGYVWGLCGGLGYLIFVLYLPFQAACL